MTSAGSKFNERSMLLFSFWMGVMFTAMGVGWGLAIQSGVILFDGIYSGLSIILSMLSIAALGMIDKPADDNFQFGRMALEPLVLALKSVVIIGVCVYGAVTAVVHIRTGGLESTSSLLGMLYAAVSIAACLLSWLYLKIRGKNMPALVQAESEQWAMDTIFSSIVLVSFLLSYLLSFTPWNEAVPYIDPGMVLLASIYFVRVPLRRFVASLRELLMMAPASTVRDDLNRRIEVLAKMHRFDGAKVRVAKIGRELAVDIAFLAPSGFGKVDIEYLDRIRAEVEDSLSHLDLKLWTNILFTKDRRWA